ncbi:MAG: RDD family protein [Cytophaga sp.]|uniref:RDD family protein n=1 Tax=Cytophaga sp. TaxID=29535 RepID=UPI003F7E0EBD
MEEKILDAFQEELPAENIEYVSLIRRFNASFFDMLLSAALTYGISYFVPGWWKSLSVAILFAVIDLLYKVVAEKVYGQTLGKKVSNIVVTTEDLRLISWQQALIRNYYYVILMVLSMVQSYVFHYVQQGETVLGFGDMQQVIQLSYINYVLAAWFIIDCLLMSKEPKNQTLHDKWAKTVVVRESFLKK